MQELESAKVIDPQRNSEFVTPEHGAHMWQVPF